MDHQYTTGNAPIMVGSDIYTSSFAQVLRRQREVQGFSQEALAHETGLDRTYISLLERGKRLPTLATVVKLSNSLNMRPEEFVAELGRDYQA